MFKLKKVEVANLKNDDRFTHANKRSERMNAYGCARLESRNNLKKKERYIILYILFMGTLHEHSEHHWPPYLACSIIFSVVFLCGLQILLWFPRNVIWKATTESQQQLGGSSACMHVCTGVKPKQPEKAGTISCLQEHPDNYRQPYLAFSARSSTKFKTFSMFVLLLSFFTER